MQSTKRGHQMPKLSYIQGLKSVRRGETGCCPDETVRKGYYSVDSQPIANCEIGVEFSAQPISMA